MEVGIDDAVPTYAGGLGILAADTIRSAADLRVPMVAVTLLYRQGYLRQRLLSDGWQVEEPVSWRVDDFLQELPGRVSVELEGRTVLVRAWKYKVGGITGHTVPILFLDTGVPGNSEYDRRLTDRLYGGDERYRLCQEAVLGIGGVRMLRALGYLHLDRFHMNEGHSSLLTVELLDEMMRAGQAANLFEAREALRKLCIFTTHTPVAAGHDQFPMALVDAVLGPRELFHQSDILGPGDRLNLSYLALRCSHFVNGVAKSHGEVSRRMFAEVDIDSITNGVHLGTWAAPAFAELYDRYVPAWRHDNFNLRYALGIPRAEIWAAHERAKAALLAQVRAATGAALDPEVLTVCFARRATGYKRPALVLENLDTLRRIAAKAELFAPGKRSALQILFAGKAHPRDHEGKQVIKRVVASATALSGSPPIVFVPDYDARLAKLMVAGSDLWLNTPEPPLEASGTSGMKAAVNGVPSFSTLDGWWLEGHIEGVTGWSIGERGATPAGRSGDAASLYDKLENVILPMFYADRPRFIDVMANAIAFNASFFNTQRMIQQYVLNAYFE